MHASMNIYEDVVLLFINRSYAARTFMREVYLSILACFNIWYLYPSKGTLLHLRMQVYSAMLYPKEKFIFQDAHNVKLGEMTTLFLELYTLDKTVAILSRKFVMIKLGSIYTHSFISGK